MLFSILQVIAGDEYRISMTFPATLTFYGTDSHDSAKCRKLIPRYFTLFVDNVLSTAATTQLGKCNYGNYN